jgi:F-type H+-transporting ATPase subunit gamma
MTADKGLAGSFNANLIRVGETMQREDANRKWYTVGNKARNAIRRLGQEAVRVWPLQSPDKLTVARELAAQVSDDFIAGRVGSVTLVSPKLINMMSQRPETRQLLPIQGTAEKPATDGPRAAVEFEPSPEAVLAHLLPKYLEFTIYAAMLETDAAFYAAQLVAMSNASDNAKKLIDQLTVQMNNARQASITKEILEIVGGAEALSG